MNDQEFSRLIEKYQKGLLTGEEKMRLDKWFDAQETSNIIWSENDEVRLKSEILRKLKTDHRSITPQRTTPLNVAWRIAASIVLLASLTYLVTQYAGDAGGQSEEIVTLQGSSSGEISKVVLADGTLVWLKGNSTLTYPSHFVGNTRKVSLQGEALFEVAKDANHPFTIQCGDLTTTVLGTSFNIKTVERNIEVVVLTGKVSLTSTTDKNGIVVLPNDKAIYDGQHRQLAIVKSAATEKVAVVTGTAYSMYFEDTQIKEVIRKIEGKFDVKVSTSNPKMGNCLITADFTDQSLERTMRIISEVLGFEYEINNNSVVLRGTGCD
jgi:transmembrane sensor